MFLGNAQSSHSVKNRQRKVAQDDVYATLQCMQKIGRCVNTFKRRVQAGSFKFVIHELSVFNYILDKDNAKVFF